MNIPLDNVGADSLFPTKTFCALPWMHLSTRPNGHMRVCCTANASAVVSLWTAIMIGYAGVVTLQL